MTTYSDTIRHWAADTRRAGTLAAADGTGEVGLGKAEAGTRLAVRFALRVRDSRIETVRYQVFGCGFTLAACAAAAELAEGHTLSEAATIAPVWIEAALAGLPPERGYCAALAVEALQAAVQSARADRRTVLTSLRPSAEDEQAPRITASDPLYRLLIDSPALTSGVSPEDRHLFACSLAVAATESNGTAAALGLSERGLANLLHCYFPSVEPTRLRPLATPAAKPGPQTNPDLLKLLLAHLPYDANSRHPQPSHWLARILAARAAHPGHLWIAMGLFSRTELTAAIHRHLPALATANRQGMRWKRFLFKQLCERDGGLMCKTPDCGTCSEHALCFARGG